MKNFFTLTLCFLTLSLTAQEACPNVFDYDNDGNVAVNDFLAMLGYFGDTDADSDGIWDSEDDCIDETACNYSANPSEPCDALDAIGVCGGNCLSDIDGDGICDLTPITNDNIHAAVDLWLSDEGTASSTYGHISDWDVSSVNDMSQLFYNAQSFNSDISSWDVSSVTDMSYMFRKAYVFNGDLSAWDVSSVTDMSYMFVYTFFNGDLSSWDVSSVTDMNHLFWSAYGFNGDLSAWNVSSVCDMSTMFYEAYEFNGDLSAWDVSSVTNMYIMFGESSSFNGDLSAWDVSSVTDMSSMFVANNIFNGDISTWDVSSVTDMSYMFHNATSFNGDLSAWDVSSVTDWNSTFFGVDALSEENKCLIHTSFSSSNENWNYDWSEFCTFVCGDLVSHAGYDYSTVQIADQCWFSENCRFLPSVSPSIAYSTTDHPYYYVYGYEGTDVDAAKSTSNYAAYGVLYNWPAVMTEGICPSGWHIPSDGEWQTMEISLGMSEADAASEGFRGSPVGDYMKSTSGWNNGGNGSNSSGFNGLPGGSRYSYGFDYNGNYGGWWSASESGSFSWERGLYDYDDGVGRVNFNRDFGFSARCVRD